MPPTVPVRAMRWESNVSFPESFARCGCGPESRAKSEAVQTLGSLRATRARLVTSVIGVRGPRGCGPTLTSGAFSVTSIGEPAQYRGVAFGDFDRDGKVDAVVTRLNEPPVLLRNTGGADDHWFGLQLTGRASNRDAIGARVIVRAGGITQVNHVTTSTGYACSSESALHFGLACR
jgi:ASPIC and UnbV